MNISWKTAMYLIKMNTCKNKYIFNVKFERNSVSNFFFVQRHIVGTHPRELVIE